LLGGKGFPAGLAAEPRLGYSQTLRVRRALGSARQRPGVRRPAAAWPRAENSPARGSGGKNGVI